MTCPDWLIERFESAGGTLSFHDYMDICLNDHQYGAYGSGKISVGKSGDFVTSPSLGSDFSDLLTVQLNDWLVQINNNLNFSSALSIVEIGPGEGHLTQSLINSIKVMNPKLLKKINFILVEPNPMMRKRQKNRLSCFKSISITWKSLQEISQAPVNGVIIANEILDALPVERLVWFDNKLWQQGVELNDIGSNLCLSYTNLPLSQLLKNNILDARSSLNISIPPSNTLDGWTTEWHSNLSEWFKSISLIINSGVLLVIDYCLHASSYYHRNRIDGTLLSYKKQQTSSDFLTSPGELDMTTHLCIETLNHFAQSNGWFHTGHVKQGEALLALGLAEKLSQLSNLPMNKLNSALEKRENLLRLVDPYLLGGFYWHSYEPRSNLQSPFRNIFHEKPLV